VASTQRRDPQEWEWRDVEYEQRRRRAKAVARRRGRLRLAALLIGAAAVIASAMLAARAMSLPAPYARASLAIVDGSTHGSVAVMGSRSDNEETSTEPGTGATASWDSGQATVSSTVTDGALISTATVSLTGVKLLDGRIAVSSIELVADAAATRTAESGGVDISRIEGLTVDGAPVAVEALPLAIVGLGTLTALERREATEANGLEAEVTGLRLHLTSAWKGLAEGSDIVVGSAAACADRATAGQLLPSPAPRGSTEGGSGGSSGGPGGGSSGGSSGGSDGGSSGGSDGGSSGGSDGGSSGGSSGGGSPSADTFRPGKMSTPHRTGGDLLSFPDAVFPIDGEFWYSDDFGAPRAVGGGHTGNDVFARKGTPVVAVQAGTVEELRYRSLGGNSFHLVNDAGDYFYYAHLLRYAAGVGNGSVVAAGQILGYVGNTGNAITTPPHLHFEIHPGAGGPIDPFPYLELWRAAAAGTASEPAVSGADAATDAESFVRPSISVEADRGRHERAITSAGFAPRALSRDASGGGLLAAAVSFGILGGLTTTAVRRRRAEVCLLSIDLEDLDRAAKAG
jgi:murein DD-endopeptidase MepM/ murein hydrolase activator NlpD